MFSRLSFQEGPFRIFFYGGVLTNYNYPTPPHHQTPSPPATETQSQRMGQGMSQPSLLRTGLSLRIWDGKAVTGVQ